VLKQQKINGNALKNAENAERMITIALNGILLVPELEVI
jgi:hypothetical protein